MIRSQEDFCRHADYIHWNPVKHGLVKRARDWPHSSFHAYLRRGLYRADWACDPDGTIEGANDAIDAVRSSPHPTGAGFWVLWSIAGFDGR
jgi:putative transposase